MTPEDHSGGPVRCEQLGPFVDGELAPDEAAAFRKHLLICARCQQEMHGLMQLSALAEQARERHPAARPEVAPVVLAAQERRARPRRAAWVGVVGGVAIAAALVLALRGQRSGPDVPTLLASLDARTVSGWPSAAGPGQYKEYRVMRGVSQLPIPPALAQAELRLQGSGDWRTLGTLALLRRDFAQADAYLARLPQTPDVLADRGLVRLEEQRYPEALEYLDQALGKAPDLLPARFNRALALQALQLPFAAAAAMGPVSRSAVGGWAEEARRDSASFESAQKEIGDERARMRAAGRALIERQEAPSPGLVGRHRSLSRSTFYHAVASAGTRAELERLRPLARELGRELGSDVLEARIQIALRGWTPARPAVAARYRSWILDLETVRTPEDVDFLLAAARSAGQKDILQQVYDGYRPYAVGAERQALDRPFNDPWFNASLAARVAATEADAGRPNEAERRIRQARELCRPESMQIPCWYLTEALGDVYRQVGRFADAEREYRTVAPRLRAAGLYAYERKANLEAARVAVQGDQVAFARASYEDLSLREPERCLSWVWSRELLASGYVARGDAASAQGVLSVKSDCKGSLDAEPWRARLRLQLGQLTGDRALLEEARSMAAANQGIARTAPREMAAARVLEGIAALELGTSEAERTLARTIAAEEASSDVQVRSAAAEGREALALRALDRKDGAGALGELGHLLGTPAPTRCAVGLVSGVARAGWVVVDATGNVVTSVGRTRGTDVSLPPEVVDRLRSCNDVAVLSTGRFQGRRGILPDDLPWSYQLGTAQAEAVPPGPERLLVRDVLPPRDLQLPSLGLQQAPGTGQWTALTGPDATPARVLAALERADVVNFEVHGLIDPSVPDGAILVLSEDSDHGYALSATQLAALRLSRRPIVMLGACRAAAPSTFRAEPWSLPRSFVQAGARGVYASLSDLPDHDVGEFFRKLTARLDAGASPAVALRDERLAWIRQGKSWVRDVVLFD
jgi:tetratricopeptide (TPR) repeat protein